MGTGMVETGCEVWVDLFFACSASSVPSWRISVQSTALARSVKFEYKSVNLSVSVMLVIVLLSALHA